MKKNIFFIFYCFQLTCAFSQTNDKAVKFDSLTTAFADAQTDTDRVLLYDKLMWTAPTDKIGVEYGIKGFELAKRIHYDKGIIQCGNNTGLLMVELDYYKAVQILLETKQTCEKTNNEIELGRSLGSLGYAYSKFDFQKAIDYFRDCKKMLEKLNVSQSFMPINAAMGYCFKDNNMPDSALIYLQKGYEYALKSPYPIKPNSFYVHFGEVYYKKGQLDTALSYFRKSIAAYSKDINNAQAVGQASYGIAQIFRDRNQIDSAKVYAKKSLVIEQAANRPVYIIKSANLLYELNKTTNIEAANKYLLIALSMKDSLFNEEKTRETEKFAYEQHEQEAMNKRRFEAHQLAFENQIKIYILSGILAGLGLLAFVFYRNNKQKQKANNVLEKTLKELKATQNQLIQSEKLASLGELTAGIAHEIQNPLNFVNNFSELNVDLVKDINDEIHKPEIDKVYVEDLLKDLTDNEKNINHHGKRAASIVSGMLEHSRASTGKKEFTDINKLCDEYFRLSYHGLRAKNKDFNAEMITNFDPTIPKIEIIPQDVGRVILNLINNAFYAVNEKRILDDGRRIIDNGQLTIDNENKELYAPIVTVTTKKLDNAIEIRVKDNGIGMSENVKAKVFQPFFTTKPTGQGTGLGLSLAYDIISKGHGGTLTVESEEGVGSEFVITLSA